MKDLRNANINLWMVTGDKLETAEHIGYSCNLFNKKTHLFRIIDTD
jgi:P-type E1-E2 ATPase